MLSLGTARHKVKHWLRRNKAALSAVPVGTIPRDQRSEAPSRDYDKEYRLFMQDLENSSQEWVGRVRMITLESIRERVGPAWLKLQGRVELLAEKLISERLGRHDRYIKSGPAEFLTFFANATPEESRIRCLAIVEAIHEKLFGLENGRAESPQRVAECHVIHKGDLTLDWEVGRDSTGCTPRRREAKEVLRQSFRHNAELLDSADVAASTQIIIDAILSRGVESRDMGDVKSLLVRLQFLSADLKTLEATLMASGQETPRETDGKTRSAVRAQPEDEYDSAASNDLHITSLARAWDDIAEVVSLLDVGKESSHADLVIALRRLQRERLERAAKASAHPAAALDAEEFDPSQFEYLPVYRSVERGERIYQGICRVNFRASRKAGSDGPAGERTDFSQYDSQTVERLNLKRAIKYLSDQKVGSHCMLMTSVQAETLRRPRSQRRYSVSLRVAELRAKRRLLIEIVGYRDTDDTIGMRRAIEELRAHSYGVFVTLDKNTRSFDKVAAGCEKSGVHAVGLDLSQFSGMGRNPKSVLAELCLIGKRSQIALHVNGIASVAVLANAIACGVSYVCTEALRPPLQVPDDMRLARMDDLYVAL